jgi:hypothetical protein
MGGVEAAKNATSPKVSRIDRRIAMIRDVLIFGLQLSFHCGTVIFCWRPVNERLQKERPEFQMQLRVPALGDAPDGHVFAQPQRHRFERASSIGR